LATWLQGLYACMRPRQQGALRAHRDIRYRGQGGGVDPPPSMAASGRIARWARRRQGRNPTPDRGAAGFCRWMLHLHPNERSLPVEGDAVALVAVRPKQFQPFGLSLRVKSGEME